MESVIEITQRDGLGRTGHWSINGTTVEIPIIANIQGTRFPIRFGSFTELETRDILNISNLNGYYSRPSAGNSGINISEYQSKIRLYNCRNPLLEEYGDIEYILSNAKSNGPHFLVPKTMDYPESFNEIGISLSLIVI